MREPADLDLDMQTAVTEAVIPAVGVHLVFVPDVVRPRMLLWGSDVANHSLAVSGESGSLLLPDESFKLRRVRGYYVSLQDAVVQLSAMTQSEIEQSPASVAVWSLAAKFLLELVARERLVPRVVKQAGEQRARWSVVLNLPQDQERFATLVQAFPVAAHAVPHATDANNNVVDARSPASADAPIRIWTAEALLREFFDTAADVLVRAAAQQAVATSKSSTKKSKVIPDASLAPWPIRLSRALTTEAAQFVPQGVQERMVLTELRHWTQSVTGAQAQQLRLCLQLQLPDDDQTEFELNFLLQRDDDPEAHATATELYMNGQSAAAKLQCELRVAHEQLLQMLAIAARSFSFIESELRKPRPDSMRLNPRLAWEFIKQVPALQQMGVLVDLPSILTADVQQRLSMQMCIGQMRSGDDHPSQYDSSDHELDYQWRATLTGLPVTIEVLHELIDLRTPLARYRGTWVVLDPKELNHALKLLEQKGGAIRLPLALSLALTETIHQPDSGLRIQVLPQGSLAELVTHMRERETVHEVATPSTFNGNLRPYQQRGMSWLAHLTQLGLGACLADDMGLGKTIQLLAYLLHRKSIARDQKPILLVCPTSVVGNWEREIARFAPSLEVLRHYGIARIQNADDFAAQASGKLVITSYGLMRRDAAWLRELEFSVVVLDEAQFIKNASSATARTARALKANTRIALTGTPVENHLAELWSIMEFLNPGLLGPHETFRREIAIPVERYGREDVAARLRRMVAPFVLRRTKNDQGIATDLPAKQETKVFCSLTREQATLYQHAIDEAFADIEAADGITRRGRVLALLTALKQICNHPAHYLREQGPLNGRSGKLDRLCEMLQEVLATQDRVLVFTQYREMGERLVRVLSRLQGKPVPFLHGGVSRAARDEMVRRFQELPKSSRIMIVSLKAGGTGLNLTAATEVFHFDRWWNPAVEDQATDRAHRIGQQRSVQVYKLLCAGTVEEKIDAMLESKRDLAARVVSGGESWITELDNHALRELFSLAPNAVVGDAPDSDEFDEQVDVVSRRKRQTRRNAAVLS